MGKITVIEDPTLSKENDKRYVVIDEDTGEVLENAQGYGFRTIQKAYAAYTFKNRDPNKDTERKEKQVRIQQWLQDHPEFTDELDFYQTEISEGRCGPDVKIDAKIIKKMLLKDHLNGDFTPGELLKEWRKTNN